MDRSAVPASFKPSSAVRFPTATSRMPSRVGINRHSETDEGMVVYRQNYGGRSLWVRPLAMFVETVEVDGRVVKRFECVEEEE